jgi:hypothetical protein
LNRQQLTVFSEEREDYMKCGLAYGQSAVLVEDSMMTMAECLVLS